MTKEMTKSSKINQRTTQVNQRTTQVNQEQFKSLRKESRRPTPRKKIEIKENEKGEIRDVPKMMQKG